ncbi:chaperone dnaJ-domain containing protein [Trifolium pratense]|uniref:Chaperone dnaJ-domain containing protein n=1 Tax=Trifolium pratense TaxID=57577 RepID=A0A2K3L1E9_TRIPR|nr:chaperone dnaJ-domain containing protein [Trifolium pratense]
MKKKEDSDDPKIWGAVLFGLIGATAATLVFGQVRKTVEWFSLQVSRSQAWKGKSGSSYRTAFQEEAWRKHNKRMQEEYEEEMERVERIRRMQNVFNRERNKHKRGYESWREQNGTGQYHQHFEREDWYWKTDASYRDRRTNYRETPRESGNYALSHHYSVLGLDRKYKITVFIIDYRKENK